MPICQHPELHWKTHLCIKKCFSPIEPGEPPEGLPIITDYSTDPPTRHIVRLDYCDCPPTEEEARRCAEWLELMLRGVV